MIFDIDLGQRIVGGDGIEVSPGGIVHVSGYALIVLAILLAVGLFFEVRRIIRKEPIPGADEDY